VLEENGEDKWSEKVTNEEMLERIREKRKEDAYKQF
jgi:hypothetical protein